MLPGSGGAPTDTGLLNRASLCCASHTPPEEPSDVPPPFWFGPPPPATVIYKIPDGVDDEHFAINFNAQAVLTPPGNQPLMILCGDASNLSENAFDVFTGSLAARACSLFEVIKVAGFRRANDSTLGRLIGPASALRELELPDGLTLNGTHVDVLRQFPMLDTLTVDSLASPTDTSWKNGHADLSLLASLRRLALPRHYLRAEEIAELIHICSLDELVVPSQFTEGDQRAIQDANQGCTISWA